MNYYVGLACAFWILFSWFFRRLFYFFAFVAVDYNKSDEIEETFEG